MASPTRQRLLVLGAALLGLAAVALLGASLLGLTGGGDRVERADLATANAALLDGRPPAPSPTQAGPRLTGSARAPAGVLHGPVVAHLLDGEGEPIGGLRVVAERGAPPEGEGSPALAVHEDVSDGLGQVRFTDLPYDGTTQVYVVARGAEEARLASVRVGGPEVTLVVERGLPFHLDVRLAGDGRALPSARWQVTPRLEWAADAFGSPRVPVRPASLATFGVHVEAPRGTVARRDASWSTWVHPRAQRLEALYPVRPELDLVVVFPPEVLPFREEDWEALISVSGLPLEQPDLRFVGNGRLRVRGGSHCVGESVTVGGTLSGRYEVKGHALIGPDPRVQMVVEVRLTPWSPPPPVEPTIVVGEFRWNVAGEGSAGVFHIVSETGDLTVVRLRPGDAEGYPPILSPPPPPPPLPATGSLVVRVLEPDGTPCVGALVACHSVLAGRSDAQGIARFVGVLPGSAEVTVLGAGASGRAQVLVLSGQVNEVEVRPGVGATLEVEFLDEEGNPIPMGSVHVEQPSGLPWIDLKQGTQRLDPFTDARGRRTLEGVEVGHVKVRGSYGTRVVDVEVDLVEGARVPVRLVLPVTRPVEPQ